MKACRLPVALLAALLALPAAAASAAPAPNAPCAVIVAAGRPIELPVQVAPGLTVRVRDPYGGGSTYIVNEDWIRQYVAGGVYR